MFLSELVCVVILRSTCVCVCVCVCLSACRVTSVSQDPFGSMRLFFVRGCPPLPNHSFAQQDCTGMCWVDGVKVCFSARHLQCGVLNCGQVSASTWEFTCVERHMRRLKSHVNCPVFVPGTPQTNSFCTVRALCQTGKGPRPIHSGPEGESELCVQRAD